MRRVVVTGMGALTPIGNSVPEYLENVKKGVNGIDVVTYFDVSDLKSKFAAQLKNPDLSAVIDKATIRKMDLFAQYALYAAEEAVNDSGILGKVDPYRFGVYFGSGIGGFETILTEHETYLSKGARRVSPLFIPKMIYNIAAGNISIKYKAKGTNMSLSTACATGATAVGEAYRAIKHGYADAIICGGTEAGINPLSTAGFSQCKALSTAETKDTASLPFDKRRKGFVMGEGSAVLIIEEYEHAVNRGAKIYAEIVGYGSTNDAYHITSPDPSAESTAQAIKLSLEGFEVPEASKIYVNAHGTGTHLNDITETLAFKQVFKEDAYKLHISSTKSMTGHMLGAAGTIEAITAIDTLRTGIIPPTINLLEKDEECDLDYTPLTAVKADIELALSTNLGFGGHNACLAFKAVK
ncbi:MAG: beta-ketoacyl-ACP synthase II [Clostridia bacterium]|nr:beta-ketoacyl-ACP synthase II [Clostridia bacterium]